MNSRTSPTVAVILPALDEADALPAALANRPRDLRTIVVDNGSSDNTADIATSLGVEVVSQPQRGFGAACKAGLDAVMDADVIVFMDADNTCDWGDLNALCEPIVNGEADLVLGRRIRSLREPDAMAFHVNIANRILGFACGRLAGTKIHDVPPYRAIRRSTLVALDLQDRTFGWPLEMVLKAGQANYRVAEVPVRYKVRTGTSKVTGTLTGTVKATRRMLVVLWHYRSTNP